MSKEEKPKMKKVNKDPAINLNMVDMKITKEGNWLQTYTSNKFDYTAKEVDRLNIHDIAHPLSQIVRFNGHIKHPYSVAQHCLTVTSIMEKDGFSKETLLYALMHDAHEAFISDVPSPLKRHIKEEHGFDFSMIEEEIQSKIMKRFGIKFTKKTVDITRKYDLIVLKSEAHSLFDKVVEDWTKDIPYKLAEKIKVILPPHQAKSLFVQTYKRLGGKL